jgi:hypothetical protein
MPDRIDPEPLGCGDLPFEEIDRHLDRYPPRLRSSSSVEIGRAAQRYGAQIVQQEGPSTWI